MFHYRRKILCTNYNLTHFTKSCKPMLHCIIVSSSNATSSYKNAFFHRAPLWFRDILEVPFGMMDCMGKSPLTGEGSHGHKQRRAGDYLLFKQIAGPVWPRLQSPLNFAPLQLFKSPCEGVGVLLRNKQLLGQNSPRIPGWASPGNADWLVDIQDILAGPDAWVVSVIARQPCN